MRPTARADFENGFGCTVDVDLSEYLFRILSLKELKDGIAVQVVIQA
jgi:hypothetical protein